MRRDGLFLLTAIGVLSFWIAGNLAAAQPPNEDDAKSASPLAWYDQGGVVVDGVAYFTSSDRSGDFPHVAAFDVDSLAKLKTYPFAKTYDSTPLLFQKRDGTWLIIAHEHVEKRTVARNRDTGQLEWISSANQPGSYFFGYSYFQCKDSRRLILIACQNGLHAMSGETGEEVWCLPARSTGGITPCVDQQRGWIFYQHDGKLLKIRANDGDVLKSIDVEAPHRCISWNTVLVDDSNGYFVATRWYGKPEWDSAIRVYDGDLNLIWERSGLPIGKKSTLTYAEGKLVVGGGNSWSKLYEGDQWKHVTAYSISRGDVVWQFDASRFRFSSIMNVPYFNGSFYAETQNGPDASQILRIDSSSGELLDVFDFGRPITSCAQCIIAHGRMFTGDLHEHRLVVTRIADDSNADWPGPFGGPQTNQMALPDEKSAKLVPMIELGACAAD
jgi:hypothetical protein